MKRRLAHFAHFRLLPALLRRWPRPAWHWPAVLLATGRALLDTRTRRLAGPALRALGCRDTRLARWRFRWGLAYHTEVDMLLGLQADRLTEEWAARQVTCDITFPPGGAVLVATHHANARLGFLRLRMVVGSLGLIVSDLVNAWDERHPAHAHWRAAFGDVRALASETARLRARTFGEQLFYPPRAARPALRFLRAGGYLVIQSDPDIADRDRWPVLGKAKALAPGAVWFAQQSGKPLIPIMLVPRGRRWRIWRGEPIEPTMAGLAGAMERCLREAPTSWRADYWHRWHEAPPWSGAEADTEQLS